MSKTHLIITLDGPAGSGKSTIARTISRELNIPYLDTGAMFRALALFLGDGSWELPENILANKLNNFVFSLQGSGATACLTMNGQLLGQEIRQEETGNWASNLGKIAVIRDFLKRAQQKIGTYHSLVAEGRDMGTVVFPKARWKFFLEASVMERAQRRMNQLLSFGYHPVFEQIFDELKARDEQDRTREIAPLKPATDAIVIDTTELSQEQVTQAIFKRIQKTTHL
jgi:cytidylate kinase